MNNYNSDKPQQAMQPTSVNNPSDELDLLDVLFQLWEGKTIIIISVILMVACCAAFIALQKEKWTSTAIVNAPSTTQVTHYDAVLAGLYAQYPQDKLPVTDLQAQLLERFKTLMRAYTVNSNGQTSFALSTELVAEGQVAPLNVSVTAATAQQAQETLLKTIAEVNARIISEYIADIRRNLEQKESELTESLQVQRLIAEDKKQQRLEAYRHALKIAEASNIEQIDSRQVGTLSDDTLFLLGAATLKVMITHESSMPLEFDKKYYDTQRQLSLLKNLQLRSDELQSFSYALAPTLPAQPNSQRKALKILLAIFAGIIVGSTFVLGRNIILDYKTTHQI